MPSDANSSPTLVNIGTHSLALYTHGPEPSSLKDPVALFVSGIASSSLNWAAVVRLLPQSLRSYTYDRSGLSNSEQSPLPPTAENIALELSLLIEKVPISNPLILVGHSWAGVLINEFIALSGIGPLAGLVLVDANHENMLQVLNPNDTNLNAISEDIEPYSGRGITEELKLTPSEWEAFLADEATPKFQEQAQKEEDQYDSSFETLRKKQLASKQPLLDDKLVYIIGGLRSRDWGRLYEKGIEKGNGSEEQRRAVNELIKTADEKSLGLMKEHLKLSRRSKLVVADESGHFVQLTQPNVVAEGVKWVLDKMRSGS